MSFDFTKNSTPTVLFIRTISLDFGLFLSCLTFYELYASVVGNGDNVIFIHNYWNSTS